MNWIKKGLIFKPEGQYDWMTTHAQCPTVDQIDGDLYRIYFSGRDKLNRSRVGFVEIDIKEPQRILRLSEKPILDLGKLGCFDSNGVTPTCVVNHGGRKYLYYIGWNRGETVSEVTGLAISNNRGITFERVSEAPILDRTGREPYLILVLSSILVEDGLWRMWYDSSDKWINKTLPKYNIKYAQSYNGISWCRNGIISLDYEHPKESRISRACVIKEDNIYKMWYCYAIEDGGYTIGYAESGEGITFSRKDEEVGIHKSKSGWDSEMICYPSVFTHKGKKYMVYNGNNYGETGFGYAIQE